MVKTSVKYIASVEAFVKRFLPVEKMVVETDRINKKRRIIYSPLFVIVCRNPITI